MPTKELLWRDEEGAPAPSRQQPGEGGEDRPIHRAIGDARIELALEDTHLVAEHHDLDVLVPLGPPRGSEQAEDPAQAEVTEGEGHGRSWSLAANTASSRQRSRFWCPTPRSYAYYLSVLAHVLAGGNVCQRQLVARRHVVPQPQPQVAGQDVGPGGERTGHDPHGVVGPQAQATLGGIHAHRIHHTFLTCPRSIQAVLCQRVWAWR